MRQMLTVLSPRECVNLLNGDLSILIRKTCPQQLRGDKPWKPEPIDVYVYCTKSNKHECLEYADNPNPNEEGKWVITSGYPYANGKVVAKFTLNKVEEISCYPQKPFDRYGTPYRANYDLLFESCLEYDELDRYLNKGNGYAWHIDNLVIFDRPKELSEFRHAHCDNLKNINVVRNFIHDDYVFQYYDNERCKNCKSYDSDANDCLKSYKPLTKAPKTFCYVEVE